MRHVAFSFVLLVAGLGWVASENVQAEDALDDADAQVLSDNGQLPRREHATWRFETDNNTLEPEQIVGQAIVGIHYASPKWGVHATWTFATDNIDEDSLAPGVDVDNNFSAVMIEWRF